MSCLWTMPNTPTIVRCITRCCPIIVELRAKQTADNKSETIGVAQELELCFELLYGVMLLRLQKKEVSTETLAAAKDVSTFLGQLSDYWKANREGKIDTAN